jgi:hypothetical protein
MRGEFAAKSVDYNREAAPQGGASTEELRGCRRDAVKSGGAKCLQPPK